MILQWEEVRVFVKPGPTDKRKEINGLSIIVAQDVNGGFEMDNIDGYFWTLSTVL
jgi:hypothetical protein